MLPPSVLIAAAAFLAGTGLVLLAGLLMTPFARTRETAKQLAAGAVLSVPSLLAHQLAAAPAALLILGTGGLMLPPPGAPLSAKELLFAAAVLLPSLAAFLWASLHGIRFGYRFAALLLAGTAAREALSTHPAARLLSGPGAGRALRLGAGLYAAAAAAGLLWYFQAAPPSGFYAGAGLGCMCGPGYWEFRDGKVHAYSPAHETRDIAADYRTAGGRTWIGTREGWRPLSSRNGHIRLEAGDTVIGGRKIFLSWFELRRLRAFTLEGSRRWDWRRVLVRTTDGRAVGGHVPWPEGHLPFDEWARSPDRAPGADSLAVYREVVRLRFAREGPLLVAAGKQEIPTTLIASVEGPAPPAERAMRGIAEVTDKEMALLRSGPPRYAFEAASRDGGPAAFFAVYRGAPAAKRLLWHAAAALPDDGRAVLSVNGVPLESRDGDSGKALRESLAKSLPAELLPDFVAFAREHHAFKANRAALAAVRAEVAKMTRALKESKKTGPDAERLKRKLAELRSQAERSERELQRGRPGPLGRGAELAELGVVEFAFARESGGGT